MPGVVSELMAGLVLRSGSNSMRFVVCLLLLARVDQASANVVHAPDIKLPGWNAAMVGKCRGGTNNVVDVSMELNGKFCSTCGSDATHMTQKECADACKAEPTCVGYDHGHDGSCTVYGPSIDETPESVDGKPWIAQVGHARLILARALSPALPLALALALTLTLTGWALQDTITARPTHSVGQDPHLNPEP